MGRRCGKKRKKKIGRRGRGRYVCGSGNGWALGSHKKKIKKLKSTILV